MELRWSEAGPGGKARHTVEAGGMPVLKCCSSFKHTGAKTPGTKSPGSQDMNSTRVS